MRKVYAVVGIVSYENEDVLGIYTSKDAAIKAATKVAKRPVDYYSDITNYDFVYVYATSLNTAIDGLRVSVWDSDGVKRANKRKADSEESYGKKIYSKNKVDGDGYSRNDPTVERY